MSADSPARAGVPQPDEPAPVYDRPSDDPAVREAIAQLAGTHEQLIVPSAVLANLDRGIPDCGGITVAMLLKQKRPLAAAALAGTILDLMTGRPDRAWLEGRTAVRMALGFYERAASSRQMLYAAKGVAWSLERWLARAEPAVELDAVVARRWRLLDELRRIPDGFPTPLVQAVVDGIKADDLATSRAAFDSFSMSSPGEAAEAHGLLKAHTEELESELGSSLPTAPTRASRPPRPSFAAAPAEPVGATTVERLSTVSTRAVKAITRTARVTNAPRALPGLLALAFIAIAVSVGWSGVSGPVDPGSIGAGLDDDRLLLAKTDLCSYLGRDRPGCVYTRLLIRGIERNDCTLMDDSLRKLTREARRHGDLRGGMLGDADAGTDARASLDFLVARVEAACGP